MQKGTARKVVLAVVLAGVVAVGAAGTVLGWRWKSNVTCNRIEIVGAQHADSAAVLKLARVDTGMALFDIDPVLVADRVRRHPWVQDADVERVPTGLLRIRLQERAPVALALSARGEPDFYLDSTGVKMPFIEGAAYDVPLVQGLRESEEDGALVKDASVRALLSSLGQIGAEVNALISGFEVARSGDVWLHTTPVDARGSMPVRLGKGGYAEKLERLHAFWHQAVLPQPQKTFEWIDLRFNGQIVTQEADSLEPSAVSDQLSAVEN